MIATKLMTLEEFALLPEDEFRYEVIKGELRRMSGANMEHADLLAEITFHLRAHTGRTGPVRIFPGDPGVIVERNPAVVVCPDIFVMRVDRLPAPDPVGGWLNVAPDLVIEILSPSDRPGEVAEKIALYRSFGVPRIWEVRPKTRSTVVHGPDGSSQTLDIDDELDGGDLLPGFRLPLRDLFRDDER